MTELQNKGAVRSMPHGAYTRVTQNDTEIKVCRFTRGNNLIMCNMYSIYKIELDLLG